MDRLPLGRIIRFVAELDAVVLVPATLLAVGLGSFDMATCLYECPPPHRVLLAGAELAIGIFLLSVTVTRWAKWLYSFLGLAALRALWCVWTGTMFSFPNRPLSRLLAAVLMLCFGFCAALAWRFREQKPVGFQKAALVIFIVSTVPILSFHDHPAVLAVTVSIALTALVVARLLPVRRTPKRVIIG